MRTFLFLLLACSSLCAQNFAVFHAKDLAQQNGLPDYWPVKMQSIGGSTNLPPQFEPPWVFATQDQLSEWVSTNAAAKELWNQVNGTRDDRQSKVAALLEERIRSGQWEPNYVRLHALESELFNKVMQTVRLNSELLLLVTKAIAGTAATNNLTGPERARVVALRPQLNFAPAPNLTQQDRDRVIFITQELAKIEALWKQARALRENIATNTVFVDPETLGTVTIGE